MARRRFSIGYADTQVRSEAGMGVGFTISS
jgi:hypothetical protein